MLLFVVCVFVLWLGMLFVVFCFFVFVVFVLFVCVGFVFVVLKSTVVIPNVLPLKHFKPYMFFGK